MAFSFNWAGIDIPQIQVKDRWAEAREDARALGIGARGAQNMIEKREADREYADILNGYKGPSTDRGPEYRALKQELASLKARNEEIARRLGIGQ